MKINIGKNSFLPGRVLALLMAALIAFTSLTCFPGEIRAADLWPEGPEITSQSACIMEIGTGTILYEKNMHKQQYPASITKILTTLLAIENCELDETVVFSADAVFKNEGETSHISRDLNERMTMEETLLAVMLESANECAWMLAEHVAAKSGGKVADFVTMMNERAAELGCEDTHFNNPTGLPDTQHYTSAYDMALISCEAYKNDIFRLITGTKTYTIPPTNKHKDPTYLNNHHRILHVYKSGNYVSPYCTGGKTGFTEAAGGTLVTFAEKNGLQICIVTMNTEDPNQYPDTLALMDYAFDNFEVCEVGDDEDLRGDKGLLNDRKGLVCAEEGEHIILPKNADYSAITREVSNGSDSDRALAVVSYSYGGRKVGSAPLVLSGETVEPPEIGVMDSAPAVNLKLLLAVVLVLAAVGVLAALFIAFRNGVAARRKRRAHRKAQKERMRPYLARRRRERRNNRKFGRS